MQIRDSVVLVTGANRGIGEAYVIELLEAKARKVYAAARDAGTLSPLAARGQGRLEPLELDITRQDMVEAAARRCTDVNLLINNAGVNFNTPLIAIDTLEHARIEMETNYFGTLLMCRAFAPILRANGGGAIINMLSILSRVALPAMGSLCASKAAALSMTQSIRAELATQGTRVIAVMPGAVDTRMSKDFAGPKMPPTEVVKEVLAAVESGQEEVYPGDMAAGVAAGLAQDPKAVEKEFARYLPG